MSSYQVQFSEIEAWRCRAVDTLGAAGFRREAGRIGSCAPVTDIASLREVYSAWKRALMHARQCLVADSYGAAKIGTPACMDLYTKSKHYMDTLNAINATFPSEFPP